MLTFESVDEAAQCDKFILETSRSFRDKYSTSIVCLSHLNDNFFLYIDVQFSWAFEKTSKWQKFHASTSCKTHINVYLVIW